MSILYEEKNYYRFLFIRSLLLRMRLIIENYIWSKNKIINNPYLDGDLRLQIPLLYSVYLEGKDYNVSDEKADLDYERGIYLIAILKKKVYMEYL